MSETSSSESEAMTICQKRKDDIRNSLTPTKTFRQSRYNATTDNRDDESCAAVFFGGALFDGAARSALCITGMRYVLCELMTDGRAESVEFRYVLLCLCQFFFRFSNESILTFLWCIFVPCRCFV